MKIIKIFLASSNELEEDRKEFQIFLAQINQDWIAKGIFFQLVIWENFIDAMSKDGLQHEYNKAIEDCDIFVLLFFTKVGQYTNKEFKTAFGAFQENKKPRIYTYFKDDLISTGSIGDEIISLLEFKKSLSELGHYYTKYRSPEDLKWKFSRQLEKLFSSIQKSSLEINEDSTQTEIDNIALTLTNQVLTDSSSEVPLEKLKLAIKKSTDLTQHTIFLLTSKFRRINWEHNKFLMEKTIPIFEALIECDHRKDKYYYYGQLGYALKDKQIPDWKNAKKNFDMAINILGPSGDSNLFFYDFNRAICAIHTDENFLESKPSTAKNKRDILKDLRSFKNNNGRLLNDILEREPNLVINRWLNLNGVKSV